MAVEIRPVVSRRELNTFTKLPWRIYRNEPNWVAPLLMDLKEQLDQGKNPFFEHAQAQYFLAWRDGRAVGRISAHIDRHLQEFQGNDWGLWGWFECGHDDRPDELHHQRRGGPHGRGPRAATDHPQPMASRLLSGAARAARGPVE